MAVSATTTSPSTIVQRANDPPATDGQNAVQSGLSAVADVMQGVIRDTKQVATTPSPSPGTPSGSYIDPAHYGAIGDGHIDNTASLNRAADIARASSLPIYLKAGTYDHDGKIDLTGVKINGDGDGSVLKMTNPDLAGGVTKGDGTAISNVKIENTDPGGALKVEAGQPINPDVGDGGKSEGTH